MFQEKIPNHDFLLAKLKHIDWRIRFFAFLDGENTLSQDEITSPHCCELGSWLDKEGFVKYKHWQEIEILDQLHTQLHLISRDVMLKKSVGYDIEKEYDTLKDTSSKMILILETLERKIASENLS